MNVHVEGILNSERLAITRALSFVENAEDLDLSITDLLVQHLGQAYRIGVTGPPGAGKSSLLDRMIEYWRTQDKKVAVISVDPSSPFTGGAILGDRVRMGRHYSDKGVFIRSMATRGSRGGLALRAQDAADIFDAAGYEIIIYETVGVGQVELDVADAADTTIVVLVPESGDDIQAMKAGLMEIADLFIINKSDRQGANQAAAQIQSMLEMRSYAEGEWHPQVVKTNALAGTGISEMMETLVKHQAFLSETGIIRKNFQQRIQAKILSHINRKIQSDFWSVEKINSLEKSLKSEDYRKLGLVELVNNLLNR
ncbi:MAG: methylmalonyl Co-A mutase-associated GTPase MeaB [Candidatus Marinimicrobia bacterium]|nr:methylmalonyl Co-A mutase-associated GTPase MeaB [Candidatus Neomarinimicrobiota bacterium]